MVDKPEPQEVTDDMTFRQYRENVLELSKNELAGETPVSYRTIRRIEEGSSDTLFSTRRKIAKSLDLEINDVTILVENHKE